MPIWKPKDDKKVSFKITWKLRYERPYSYGLFTKLERTGDKNRHWCTQPTDREHHRWRKLKEKGMPSNFTSMSHLTVKSNCLDAGYFKITCSEHSLHLLGEVSAILSLINFMDWEKRTDYIGTILICLLTRVIILIVPLYANYFWLTGHQFTRICASLTIAFQSNILASHSVKFEWINVRHSAIKKVQ